MRTPLLIPAIALSAGSLAWTTWSLVDLLGAGPIGLTVAAGADIIWASVIVAEARGLRIAGNRWPVAAIGWAALLAVGTFLVWHGIARDHTAMAVAGPLLPIGAKLVWLLALADMRDPSALTDDEQAKLAALERGLRLAEAEHQIELRQRQMTAERLLADVSVDFEIELTRQEKGRELARRAPIAIAPITGEQPTRRPFTFDHVNQRWVPIDPDQDREQHPITPEQPHASGRPESAVTSAITDREQPSIGDLAREHVAITPDNAIAISAICSIRPDAHRPSVAAAVRRARQQLDTRGGYR